MEDSGCIDFWLRVWFLGIKFVLSTSAAVRNESTVQSISKGLSSNIADVYKEKQYINCKWITKCYFLYSSFL
jgi:acyl-CoA synthetase (AMP-forming)/AMP-acid ligase II